MHQCLTVRRILRQLFRQFAKLLEQRLQPQRFANHAKLVLHGAKLLLCANDAIPHALPGDAVPLGDFAEGKVVVGIGVYQSPLPLRQERAIIIEQLSQLNQSIHSAPL